jgi:hypothetical protein
MYPSSAGLEENERGMEKPFNPLRRYMEEEKDRRREIFFKPNMLILMTKS